MNGAARKGRMGEVKLALMGILPALGGDGSDFRSNSDWTIEHLQRRLFHPQVKFRRYPSLGGRRRGAKGHTPPLDLSAVCDKYLRKLSPGLQRHMPVSCSAPHLIMSTLQRSLFHPQVRFRRYPSLGGRWRGAMEQTSLLDLSAVCDEQLRELFLLLRKLFLSRIERQSDERCS